MFYLEYFVEICYFMFEARNNMTTSIDQLELAHRLIAARAAVKKAMSTLPAPVRILTCPKISRLSWRPGVKDIQDAVAALVQLLAERGIN